MTDRPARWFREPARPFRTAAFWFWHRIPTESEIVGQLADMRDKGIGAIMIQARPALDRRAYLSDSYLAAYRRACVEAGRQGLGITIYDEYGWMSGHGGGRTVEGADHLRERHLFWTSGHPATDLTITDIRAPFFEFLGDLGRDWLYDGGMPRWDDWRSVLAVAHPRTIADEGDIRVLGNVVRIETIGPASCRIAVEPAQVPDDWLVTVFASARCRTSRLVNYLLPDAATRFAETVYAPLLDAAGGAAESVFFDHPHAGFYVWNEHAGNLGNSLLSDGLPAAFDDAAALLSLARDVGPRTASLRAGLLETYSRRMHDAFFGTLSRWTGERGVGFTGHELLTHVGGWTLHGGLKGFDPRAMPGVDYFGIDAYRTETAADAADYAPQLSARLGDSVARANGRKRCTVEQYSTGRDTGMPALAGQWGLTPERFRAQAIRHILTGARRIVLHAVNVTDGFDDDDRLLANPRFDFPPAFNFEPWWEDCPAIFAELARLSAFLEEGEPLRPVALLYPLDTIRAEGPAHPCGEVFGRWAQALANAGIGYDIVDEATLAAALEPERRYETLILPAVTSLASSAAIKSMSGFAKRGGRILASGRTCARAGRDAVAEPSEPASWLASDREGLIRYPDSSVEAITACIAALPRVRPEVRFEDGDTTRCSVALCGDAWRIAIFNDAATLRHVFVETGVASFEVSIWAPDAAEGLAAVEPAIDGTGFSLPIGAQRAFCLTIREGVRHEKGRKTPTSPVTVPAELVSLVLADGWTLQIAGGDPVPIMVDRGWEQQGFSGFSGTGLYRRSVLLPQTARPLAWRLSLPKVHETADLRVDGVPLGRHIAGDASFALPLDLGSEFEIELRVRNTAANRYYSDTAFGGPASFPSGLAAPPRLIASTPDARSHGRRR
ncbi:hypothetical protein GCM10011390_23680 [Aureimonas endophytica]|uniref:Alpha-L-rhamnosidase-like protein n=1 Tax=Aureimonas endophytica TaxID=2027858 RepID=A0A917E6E8_9HYPH|nr:carbohydrate-binding protein [Aureimonas endophytica]GGE04010.1 hypothetical protein GCM10011390_23680 [Aureimonas endophytica]